jgi:hypothetical protein
VRDLKPLQRSDLGRDSRLYNIFRRCLSRLALKIGNFCTTVRSLILEIQERIKSCRVRDVVDKETQAISSVKESVVFNPHS